MPRIARMVIEGEQAVYHVMSRTALDGFPFGDVEKEAFIKIIREFSQLYFLEVLGLCITLLNSLRYNVLHICAAK